MSTHHFLILGFVLLPHATQAADVGSELAAATEELATTEYELAYQFEPGEVVRYSVEHLATVDTKISGNKQVTRSRSASTKALTVETVEQDKITFTNRVENVDLWRKNDGEAEVRYNSRKDSDPPKEYQNIAQTLGKTIATVTINRAGRVIVRDGNATPDLGFGGLVVPLPEKPAKLGHSWSVPKKHRIKNRAGLTKTINTRMRYRLEKVSLGIATISVKTEVLTPINDAAVKSQLVQQLSHGEVKFDMDAGRVVSKQLDWTETVIGFNGPESNMKYLAQFTEKLQEKRTASKPQRQSKS